MVFAVWVGREMNCVQILIWILKRHGLAEFGIQNESEIVLPDIVAEDGYDGDDEYFRNLIVRVVETKSHIVEELLVHFF